MAIDWSGFTPAVKEEVKANVSQQRVDTPEPAPSVSSLSSYDKTVIAQLLDKPAENREPSFANTTPYDVNRIATEAGVQTPVVKGPGSPATVLPGRKEQLAFLAPSIWGGADLANLKDAPLANAYKLKKIANEHGYDVLFTSGARPGSGKSYHNRGEAVDVRFQRIGQSGKRYDLTPKEEVAIGAQFGKAAGWASLLDEIHYDPSGAKSGPHLHLSHGLESNLLDDPSHHLLNESQYTDPNYLKLNPTVKLEEPGNLERSRIPSAIETVAKAHGLDPDIVVRMFQAESGFNPKAQSPAGAYGLAQMMPGTVTEVAKELGVSPDVYYKNHNMQIRFGIHYFKKQLDANHGNYARALASYNAGPGATQEFIGGKPVHSETKDYVRKIMSGIDPSITDEASAEAAIIKGYGRTLDPAQSIATTKEHLQNIRSTAESFWKDLAGAVEISGKEALDIKNPTSGVRTAGALLNDFLHQASLGIVPMLQSSLESEEARSVLLQDAGLGANLLGGVLPKGAANLVGMMAGGSLLLKALRLTPFFGATAAAGESVAARFGASENPLIKGIQSLAVGGAKSSGGPLAILTADLLEQASVGALQMGTYGLMDWLQTSEEEKTPYNMAKQFLGNSLIGGFLGTAFGVGIPLAASLGLNTAANALGRSGSTGSMASVLGKYYKDSNWLQRGLIRTGAGAATGAMTAGIMDVTGVSQALFGHDTFSEGASIGATAAALGVPVISKAVDWSGLSKAVTKMPGWSQVLNKAGEWVDKLSQAQINYLTTEAFDHMASLRDLQKRHYIWENATVAEAGLRAGSSELLAAHNQSQAQVMELDKQSYLLQSQAQGIQQVVQQLETQFPNAKSILEFEQNFEQRMPVLQQQMEAIQQAGPVQPMKETAQNLGIFSPEYAAKLAESTQTVVGQPQVNPQAIAGEMQALVAQQAQIKTLMEKTPELNMQVQQLRNARMKAQKFMPELQARLQELNSRKQVHEGNALGLKLAAEQSSQIAEAAAQAKLKAKNPEDLSTLNWGVVKEGPWNPEGREFLNPEQGRKVSGDVITDFVNHFVGDTIESGGEFHTQQFASALGAHTVTAANPAGHRSTFLSMLEEVKGKVQNLKESAKESFPGDSVTNRSESKEMWAKNSTVGWAEDVLKDSSVALVDARTMFEGLLVEHPDVDLKTATAEASRIRNELSIHKNPRVLEYNEKDPASVIQWAKAHLDMGETHMPLRISGTNVKTFKDRVVKPLFEKQKAAELSRLENEVSHMEELVHGKDPSRRYAGPMADPEILPLLTYDPNFNKGEGGYVPVDPNDSQYAQGAEPRSVMDPKQVMLRLKDRITSIEKDLMAKAPTLSQSLTRFIKEGGDLSMAPADVQNFVRAKGSLSDPNVPQEVKNWINELTSLHVEEVKRQRWLDRNVIGRADGGKISVVSAMRELRAQNMDEKLAPGEVKQLVEIVAKSVSLADQGDIRAFNTWVADMAKSDKLDFNQLFGVGMRGWHDLVMNRHNTAGVIMERMIAPAWNKYYTEFQQKLGQEFSPKQAEEFKREFANAIEDHGEMKRFREKYKGNADDLLQMHYSVQSLFEFIKTTSPELYDWARANYWAHRWQKMSAHNAAAREQGRAGMSAGLASENMREFDTLKDADKQRAQFRDYLTKRGITEEEFLGQFDAERAMLMKFGRDATAKQAWDRLGVKEKDALMKEANKQARLLLADEPVVDPLQLYSMQLSSIWRADGMRRLMRTWANTSVQVEYANGTKGMLPIVGFSDSYGTPHGNQAIAPPNMKAVGYKPLSDMENFRQVTFRTNEGIERTADQIWVHPEVWRYLSDFAGGSTPKPGKFMQIWNRAMSFARSNVLLGSFIPHLNQITTASMAEFWRTPYKAANLMGAGKRIESSDLHSAAAMAEAVRHGLNIRSIEQGTKAMAESIIRDLGPEMSNSVLGVGDVGMERWLQSMDFTDPMQAQAKAALGKAGKATSDVLGTPLQMDYLINRDMLFKPIEHGQLAGYHFRVMEYLKDHAAELSKLPPMERMRTAQMAAADMTNRLSGSFPAAWGNSKLRQLVTATTLTPSWFLSKAYTIADSIDSLVYLAAKGVHGKNMRSPLEFFGRQAFSGYAPEFRDAIRTRMAKMISVGLMSSFAATQAAQYLIDGTFTWNHPPDKWFHVHHRGTYYTGPTVGYVRDLLNFFKDMSSEDGVSLNRSSASVARSIYPAVSKAIERQLAPPVEGLVQMITHPDIRGQLSEDTLGTFAEYLNRMSAQATSMPELIGMDSRNVTAKDLVTRLGSVFLSPEATQESKAKALNANQFLARMLGTYDSREQNWMNVRGNLQDRQRAIQSNARRAVSPYLEKLRLASNRGDWKEVSNYHNQILQVWSTGVPVKDKDLKPFYPGSVYRLSSQEIEAMIEQALLPENAAIKGAVNTPVGQAVMQTMHNFEQDGSVLMDSTDEM